MAAREFYEGPPVLIKFEGSLDYESYFEQGLKSPWRGRGH
jgi:hypothetical protein